MTPWNRLLAIRNYGLMSAGLLLLPLAFARAQVVSATVPAGPNPVAIAVNPVTNKIYVADCILSGDNQHGINGNVTVIDGVTNAATTITVGVCPIGVAVNPTTNMIYVADFGHYSVSCSACVDPGMITVIDGATNSTAGIYDSNAVAPQAVAVNSATNKIYVGNNFTSNVTVIDGATNSFTTIPVAGFPWDIAVNSVTNKIYVTNFNPFSAGAETGVTVIDGASGSPTTVTDPNAVNPVAVAVDSVTNKVYVTNLANCDPNCTLLGSVTVIDGASNSTTNIFDPQVFAPNSVAVNTASDKIYVSNGHTPPGGGNGGVTVIDGSTNSFVHVTDPNAETQFCDGGFLTYRNVAVDPATGNAYVANSCSANVSVINAATNTPTRITDPNAAGPNAVGVNPTTDKIYVVNYASNNVTVIDGGAGASSVTLSVSLAGAGSSNASVTSSPAGINCPGSCSATFSNGTTVTLTTSLASPFTFSGWSGACAGTAACNVTMSANENVTATFGNSTISVSLSPSVASVPENTLQVFTASVPGDSKNLGVTWSISATCNSGEVLPACYGAFGQASATAANYVSPNGGVGVGVTITATSVADITKSASVTFTIATAPPPDFFVTAQSPTASARPGQIAGDSLTIGSGPNFVGTVQLSCVLTGPSPLPACTLNSPCDLTGGDTCESVLEVDLPASTPTSNIYTATVTGTSGAEQHTVQVTVTVAPDFTLTPASTSLTIQPGGQGTDVITLAGVNGPFGSAIQLTCVVSGPSPAPTCAFSPTFVTPGSSPVTSTLTVTASGAAAQLGRDGSQLRKLAYALWLPLMFGLVMAGRSSQQRRDQWICCGILLLLFLLLPACGGGNNTSGPPPPTNYTVAVTGTSGSTGHGAQIMVTVQ